MTTPAIIGICCGFLLLVWFIITYNSLVGKKNQVKNVSAGLKALFKKRYDLIPNLAGAVKQYMQHENNLLTQLTAMRTATAVNQPIGEADTEMEKKLHEMLRGIIVSVENYPDLKSSANFLQLQVALNEIEDQISAGRRAYNAAVTDYNNALEMFPSSIVGGLLGYKQRPLFTVPDAEQGSVNIPPLFN